MALPHPDIFLCLFACCLFAHSCSAPVTSATTIASTTDVAFEVESNNTNGNSLPTSALEEETTTSASVITSSSVKDVTSASKEKTTTSASEEDTTTAVYTTQTPSIKIANETATSVSNVTATTFTSIEIVTTETETLGNTTTANGINPPSSSLKPKWQQTTTPATTSITITPGSSFWSNLLRTHWLLALAIVVVIIVFSIMVIIISLWCRKKRRMEGDYKVAHGSDMWAGELSTQHREMAEQDILNKEDRVERTEEGLGNSDDRNGGQEKVQGGLGDDVEIKICNMDFQTFSKHKHSEPQQGQKKADEERNKPGSTENVVEMELESAMGSMGSNFQFLGIYNGMKDTASTDTLTSALTRDEESIAKTEL